MPEGEEPKLIIDTDWKSQAQAEKERLAAAEEAKRASAVPGSPGAEGPPPLFAELVRMLATQAIMYMGGFPDPETGRAIVALDLAKLYVDMLGDLEAKTKGNLTQDEAAMLTRTAAELRLEFVEVSKVVAQAVKEGKISAAPGRVAQPGPGGVVPPGASGVL